MHRITQSPSNRARRSTLRAAIPVALALLVGIGVASAPAQGQTPPESFAVEVSGSGPPMILIPGLASPGQVWEPTLGHLDGRYEAHVLTLAGFAGQPPIDDEPFLERVRDDIIRYIQENGLEQPVVLGHSLGGFMAVWLAASEPQLVGPVISVDGLPFLPAVFPPGGATPESMRPQAEAMRNQMASQSPEVFEQSQHAMLRTMVTDTAVADRVAGWTSRSDPGTVAQAMYELFTTDLRPQLPDIQSPVLVYGSWVAYGTRDEVLANYEREYAAVADAEIRLSETGRHFLMYDDPAGLHGALDAFLARTTVADTR